MARHALVRAGAVLRYEDFTSFPPALAPNKGAWLPVEVENEIHDEVNETRSGPEIVIEKNRIVHRYTVRPKNDDELAELRRNKADEIEAEFQRRWQLPITHEIDGAPYEWHADQEAVDNIIGVLMSYREADSIGITLPDPRNWTPLGFLKPLTIARKQLVGLGLAIGGRKEALFVRKKIKQTELAALEKPADILAYDAAAGWE